MNGGLATQRRPAGLPASRTGSNPPRAAVNRRLSCCCNGAVLTRADDDLAEPEVQRVGDRRRLRRGVAGPFQVLDPHHVAGVGGDTTASTRSVRLTGRVDAVQGQVFGRRGSPRRRRAPGGRGRDDRLEGRTVTRLVPRMSRPGVSAVTDPGPHAERVELSSFAVRLNDAPVASRASKRRSRSSTQDGVQAFRSLIQIQASRHATASIGRSRCAVRRTRCRCCPLAGRTSPSRAAARAARRGAEQDGPRGAVHHQHLAADRRSPNASSSPVSVLTITGSAHGPAIDHTGQLGRAAVLQHQRAAPGSGPKSSGNPERERHAAAGAAAGSSPR